MEIKKEFAVTVAKSHFLCGPNSNKCLAFGYKGLVFSRSNNGCLGNIHVLRNHKQGGRGVSQMLTIAYVGGGGAKGSCLRNHILEKKYA